MEFSREMKKFHDDILLQKIADRIRSLRNEASISQKELQNITDINIDRLETGKINITVSTIKKLCDYFRISLSEFFQEM